MDLIRNHRSGAVGDGGLACHARPARVRVRGWWLACLLVVASAIAAAPPAAPPAAPAAATVHALEGRVHPGIVPATAERPTGVGPRIPAISSAGVPVDPWAAFETPWFDVFGEAQGLPHPYSTTVAQDRQGLVWVGTMDGLVRYDGYHTQVFGQRHGDRPGLPDAYVRQLLALDDGSVLVGTNAGGLTRFDPRDNGFHDYRGGRGGVSGTRVQGLARSADGRVWVASDGGLDLLDPDTGAVQPQPRPPGAAVRAFSVLEDRAGNVWLGNDDGLLLRRPGAALFERIVDADRAVAAVLGEAIWALHEDAHGRIWVGGLRAGAVYRSPDGRWHPVPGLSGDPARQRHPTVRGFLTVLPGRVWIATDGGGIRQFDIASGLTTAIARDPALPSSLPGDTVRCLSSDRTGNIWVATDQGVARYQPSARTVFTVRASPLAANTLSSPKVIGLLLDRRGRLWLGLTHGRIDVVDLARGRIDRIALDGSQDLRDVRALVQAPDGAVWAAAQGVVRIDPETLRAHNDEVPALADQAVLSLAMDGHRLLVGTYQGLYRFDPRTRALERRRRDPDTGAGLPDNRIYFASRVDQRWWYSTSDGIAVARGDSLGPDFDVIPYTQGSAPGVLQGQAGNAIHAGDGRIYVATIGGIARSTTPAAARVPAFRTLPVRTDGTGGWVAAVNDDGHGSLWASLSDGLARLDMAGESLVLLGERDGLHAPRHSAAGTLRTPDGSVLFAGNEGLTVVRPQWRSPPPIHGELRVTHAAVGGRALPYALLPGRGGTLEVGEGTRSARIAFSLLDFQGLGETRFRYRLEGLDEDWTEIPRGSPPTAIYTTLPAGRYTLQLQAQTLGIGARQFEERVGVVVAPRWHETVVARLLAVLAAACLVLAAIHGWNLHLRRRAERLRAMIDRRTADLVQANQRLDRLANLDPMTGCFNRRHFFERIGAAEAAPHTTPSCLALIDVDHFKRINDRHGHLAGDAVLRELVAVLSGLLRKDDLLARYGGEEFVLYLPDATATVGRQIGERLCQAVAAHPFEHEGVAIPVTASIGIAAIAPGEALASVLSRADGALYQAKREGRDRSILAG